MSSRGNKRCRNDRLLESGYVFQYPSFREGYRAVLEAEFAMQLPVSIESSRAARSLTLQAGQRLRDTSLYLLGFAYLILFLFIVLGGVLAVGLEPFTIRRRRIHFLLEG